MLLYCRVALSYMALFYVVKTRKPVVMKHWLRTQQFFSPTAPNHKINPKPQHSKALTPKPRCRTI